MSCGCKSLTIKEINDNDDGESSLFKSPPDIPLETFVKVLTWLEKLIEDLNSKRGTKVNMNNQFYPLENFPLEAPNNWYLNSQDPSIGYPNPDLYPPELYPELYANHNNNNNNNQNLNQKPDGYADNLYPILYPNDPNNQNLYTTSYHQQNFNQNQDYGLGYVENDVHGSGVNNQINTNGPSNQWFPPNLNWPNGQIYKNNSVKTVIIHFYNYFILLLTIISTIFCN
jgi:hypothetical protein